MNVSDVINKNAIALNLNASTKDEAIRALADLLYKDGAITSLEDFIEDVYLREAEGKTGIGSHVAIPHGKSDSVRQTCIAVAKLKNGIEWETIDEKPVKVIFLFAVDIKDKGNTFVKLMSQVARKLAHDEVCKRLLEVEQAEEVLDIFNQ